MSLNSLSYQPVTNQRDSIVSFLQQGTVVAKYSRSIVKLKTWRFRRLTITPNNFLDWQTNQSSLASLVGIQIGKIPKNLKTDDESLVCVM